MLRLNTKASNLADIFGITDADVKKLFSMTMGFYGGGGITISSVLRRIWIDECLSDNVKCWAIFEFGKWVAAVERGES